MLFRSNDTATTEIYTVSYTLSLHDALPILARRVLTLTWIIYEDAPKATRWLDMTACLRRTVRSWHPSDLRMRVDAVLRRRYVHRNDP